MDFVIAGILELIPLDSKGSYVLGEFKVIHWFSNNLCTLSGSTLIYKRSHSWKVEELGCKQAV